MTDGTEAEVSFDPAVSEADVFSHPILDYPGSPIKLHVASTAFTAAKAQAIKQGIPATAGASLPSSHRALHMGCRITVLCLAGAVFLGSER